MGEQVLMLVQIDDRSGEALAYALDELVGMGVRNVQLLSTHTKKGRPGRLLLLDLDRDLETPVAVYLAAELGAWGYHILSATHRHFDVALERRQVSLRCGDRLGRFDVACKLFRHGGTLLRVKLEHEDAVGLHDFARSAGGPCPLEEVRAAVEQAVRREPDRAHVEVAL